MLGAFNGLSLPKLVTIVCLENDINRMFILKLDNSFSIRKFNFDVSFALTNTQKQRGKCRILPQQ